jgi:CubicO group peptidase (beta-lactamase class C family)/sugar lactone lactonase YvrE
MKITKGATTLCSLIVLLLLSCVTGRANESTFQLPPELFLPELVLNNDTIPPSSDPARLRKKYRRFIEENFIYEYEGQQRCLADFFSDAEVRSFLIMKDGRIVYEYYKAPCNRYSKQQSWSMSKQILSILVGIAIDQGAIDSVEDPMDKYDPRLRDNGFAGVSFRQALQMSSGIKYDEENDRYQLFFDIIKDTYTSGRLGYTLVEKTTAPELVREYEPDSRWQYASINSQAIAMALTAAVGEPLQDYLWKKLWDPMGMEHGAKILVDREHTEFTFCCLYATTRSYAAIGQLYANGGHYNGKQIVSQDWVRLSTTLDDPHSWSGEYANPEGITSDNFGFAYHWWPLKGDRGDFTALGVYGQSIHVLPKQNTVVVRTSGDFEVEGAHRDEALVLGRAIADYLDDNPLKLVAMVPAPGQPEGIAVDPVDGSVWVTSNQEKAEVVVWHFSVEGELLETYPIVNHSNTAAHGANGVTLDGNGRVYIMDYHLARIIRLDPVMGTQEVYGTVPDLPTCLKTGGDPSNLGCESTLYNRQAWPNWGTFAPDGTLYISDINQGYIWTIAPGGGVAEPWFSDELFHSYYSLNGMQFDAEGGLVFVLTYSSQFDLNTLGRGVVYRIPVLANGSPGKLEQVSTFGIGDGMAIGMDGKIYLPISNPLVPQIHVVDPELGNVVQRLPEKIVDGGIPLDGPASVAFRGTELLITNHALFTDNPDHWAILAIDVGQQGLPLFYPVLP